MGRPRLLHCGDAQRMKQRPAERHLLRRLVLHQRGLTFGDRGRLLYHLGV